MTERLFGHRRIIAGDDLDDFLRRGPFRGLSGKKSIIPPLKGRVSNILSSANLVVAFTGSVPSTFGRLR